MTFNPLVTSTFAVPSATRRREKSSTASAHSEAPKLAPSTARGGVVKRRLYRRLLADILQGHLAPGRALCMRDLARDCSASTTSVRQVLTELVRDRLVTSSPGGYEVAPAKQTELLDLTRTACWFAEIGIRESIRRGDRQWEENVLRTYRAVELAGGPTAGAPPMYEQLLAFNDALVSACHSAILAEQCRSLNERLLRYRNLATAATGRDYQHSAFALPLRDAALARNTELASEVLVAHYRITEQGILSSGILS